MRHGLRSHTGETHDVITGCMRHRTLQNKAENESWNRKHTNPSCIATVCWPLISTALAVFSFSHITLSFCFQTTAGYGDMWEAVFSCPQEDWRASSQTTKKESSLLWMFCSSWKADCRFSHHRTLLSETPFTELKLAEESPLGHFLEFLLAPAVSYFDSCSSMHMCNIKHWCYITLSGHQKSMMSFSTTLTVQSIFLNIKLHNFSCG